MSLVNLHSAANTCYGLLGLSLGLYLKPPAACPDCACGTVYCGAKTDSHYSWSGVCFVVVTLTLLAVGASVLWRLKASEIPPKPLRPSFAAAPEFAHYGGAVRR